MAVTTIVSVSNNITIQQVQPSYTTYGMGTIPANMAIPRAIANLMTTQVTDIQNGWPASFPAFTSFQSDSGIMGPYTSSAGPVIAPPCVVQQITVDFQSWNLPLDNTAINQMAKQMVNELVSRGGFVSTSYGITPIGTNQNLYWGVSLITQIINNTTMEEGVIYGFAAVLG
jgi:hypothetical protein